ncbi:unnamed protein product [Rhodiola kirilowii]
MSREGSHDNFYGDDNYHAPTMGELSAPYFRNQLWCIHEGPELENIAIDMSIIPNLPKFSGTNEDSAMTHIQRLHGICQILKPYQVNVDDFKLKAFYFSLIDAANDWFLTLPSGSIRTWVQMQGKFLDKYYPATKAKEVRRQLQDIRQEPNETIYDYLERFNRLERSCGTLGMPEKFIIEYLIDGLKPLDKMLLDASAGGSMMNLPLSSIRDLITKAAENARFRKEVPHQDESFQTKNVSQTETAVNSIPEEIKQLKEMMMQFLQKQTVQVIPCEFCDSTDHKTNACPSNHPGPYQSLEDMIAQLSGTVQQLSTTMHQFQAEIKEELSDLKMHISQPAAPDSTHANKIERLLLQTIQGIQKDVNALTLRSGKTLANKPLEQEEDRPDNDKTWVTHADNGRYAFTVCITPPPIIHSDIPASGWDDEDNLKWNSPTNIYALRQNICRENRKFNGVDYTIPKPRNGQNGPTIDRARTSDHESQPEEIKTQEPSQSPAVLVKPRFISA